MKKKMTLTQLKKLIKEGTAPANNNVSLEDAIATIDGNLSDAIDILNDWHSEMDHTLYSQLWDLIDDAWAAFDVVKAAAQKGK